VETARLVLRVGLGACVALAVLVALATLSLVLSSCRAPEPPNPVPPEEMQPLPPPVRRAPGGTSNLAQNPTAVPVGTPCLEYADPSTCALAVSVKNAAPIPVSFPDGGAILANQGAPNDGGVNAWPVTDPTVETNTGMIAATNTLLGVTNAYLYQITPASNGVAIYPNDDAGITGPDGGAVTCKSVNVTAGGTINVDFQGGENSVSYTVVVPGVQPIQITRLHNAGTTACPDAGSGCTCLY